VVAVSSTAIERPEDRAGDRRQIGKPAALPNGLDVAGPDDHGLAQRSEVDFLGVHGSNHSIGGDE
jgi:hypothetical protein